MLIEWLGIGHLFELSRSEAIAGFFMPLVIFAVFFLAQVILPARRVSGYVVNPETGAPRNYRLNGLLVFVIALVVWAFELTGMPRDWFYRSSVYAVAGGTVFTTIFAIIAVYSRPQGKIKNPLLTLWDGRARELSFFNERFDVKMYFYVVGGAMLSLNALSGAVYHYERFGADSNPGVFLFAAFFTFYILDYFVFERVMLYTYDLMHEGIGFKLFWGGLVVYGWLFILPLWGMAVYPDPGFSPAWTNPCGSSEPTALFLLGWGISRGANNAEIHVQTMARPQVSRADRTPSTLRQATARSCAVVSGVSPATSTIMGEGFLALSIALVFGYFTNPWAWTYFVFIVALFIHLSSTL